MFDSVRAHFSAPLKRALVSCAIALSTVVSAALISASSANGAANDFNFDNKSDLVLANANGLVDMLLMNGTSTISRTIILSSPGWAISHLADFNGDGKTDILWRNVNGAVTVWLMNGPKALMSSQPSV